MPQYQSGMLPDLRSGRLNTDEKLKALANYIVGLDDKLKNILNNIDEDNMSPVYNESAGATTVDALSQKVSALSEIVKQMKSYVDANVVFAKTVVGAINATVETEKIHPEHLDLIGYGALVDQFRFRALDIIGHPFAIIGDTTADNDGRIAGGSYAAGNMVFTGEVIDHAKSMPSLNSAPKLKINAGNINYSTGAAPMQNLLGIDTNGNIRLFGAYVEDGQLLFSNPTAVTLPAATAREVNTILAWMPAIGLTGYKLPDESSDVIGSIYSDSEYIYTAHVGGWYYITHQVDLTGSNITAKNTIAPCWIKPYEGEYATYTRNCAL